MVDVGDELVAVGDELVAVAPGGMTGGVEAFVAAYRATLPAVFGYLLRATGGDRGLAEDVTSETYIAALTAWRSGKADAVSAPWLVGVARHKLIDRFRRAEREARGLALVHAAAPDAADDEGFAGVDRATLLACTRELSPLQRAVLALRYADGLTLAEIATELDRSVSAVDSLLRRARAELRTKIERGDAL